MDYNFDKVNIGKKMEREKDFRLLFVITLIVAIILACFLIYLFLIKPTFQGYVVQKQIEAGNSILGELVNQVQQNGYVQIPLADNQSLILVPYNPQTAGQQIQK